MVSCSFIAASQYILPLFVLPCKRMSPHLEQSGPPGALYHCSPNGWITTQLFTKWLKHFAAQTNASIQKPVLLVMDNHPSHTSIQSSLFCKESGICIVSVPPHTPHRLQLLDLTFFGPLKSALHKECDFFMKCHASEKIMPCVLASLFNKAYSRVSSLEKDVKCFEKSVIWPLNPETYSDEDFMAGSNLQGRCEHEEEPITMIPIPTDDLCGSSGPSETS